MSSPDALIRQVAEHRQAVGTARPYPPAADCIAFSLTEGAELIDAYLRLNPRYLRNNAKQPDPANEAADLGYMIASAIDQIDAGNTPSIDPRIMRAALVVDRLCWAMIALDRGQRDHARKELLGALDQWQALCKAQEWRAEQLIADLARRIDAKYKAPADEPARSDPALLINIFAEDEPSPAPLFIDAGTGRLFVAVADEFPDDLPPATDAERSEAQQALAQSNPTEIGTGEI